MTAFGPAYDRMMRNAKPQAGSEAEFRHAYRVNEFERLRLAAERAAKHREHVQKRMLEQVRPRKHRHSFQGIARRICEAFQMSMRELSSRRRSDRMVLARGAIIYWTCRLTPMSLSEIGRRLNRDHTSVLHALRVYPERRAKMGRHLRRVR